MVHWAKSLFKFSIWPVTCYYFNTLPLCFCSNINIDSAYWVVKYDFYLRSGLLHGLKANKCY